LTAYSNKPKRFLERLFFQDGGNPVNGICCAGFELKAWRCVPFAEHLIEWLPEYALPEDELALPLVVDADAEHVARQQIARELNAAKLASYRLGDGARERRLADARNVLDEEMAARQEGHERELDGLLLALERTLHRLTQRLERRELRRDAGRSGHDVQGSTEVIKGRDEAIAFDPEAPRRAPAAPTRYPRRTPAALACWRRPRSRVTRSPPRVVAKTSS